MKSYYVAQRSLMVLCRGSLACAAGVILSALLLGPVAAAQPGEVESIESKFQYWYPFDTRIPVIVGQGAYEELSHKGSYAFDFGLPIGREILASRRGVVAATADGFTSRCVPVKEYCRGNYVAVKHRDGSVALYLHLRAGVPVKVGDKVRTRQVIGYSGNTGPSSGPHLHFQVGQERPEGRPVGVSFRFRSEDPAGSVPVRKDWILQRPKANVNLSISTAAGSAPIDGVMSAKLGDIIRLRVARAGRRVEDVTRDTRTRFYTPTPWLVGVNDIGRVQVRRDPAYTGILALVDRASVTVVFDDPKTGEVGFAELRFVLEESETQPAGE